MVDASRYTLPWLLLACATNGNGPIDGTPEPGDVAAGSHYFATASDWLSGRETYVQGWDGMHHRIALTQKGTDGRWDGYWADEGGTIVSCITCSVSDSTSTQRGIGDVFPDGNYVVLTVEKSNHPGVIGDGYAAPGRGLYNDVWIARADGTQAWQMTNIPADADHGIIWPRLSADGSKLVWAEMYQGLNLLVPKQQLGSWRIKLADVVWSAGAPTLSNVQTYEPEAGNFYETYGFSPDGSQILFASSAFMPGVSDAQIYRVSTQLTELTRLSDQHTPGWSNYNEFAFYAPDADHIIYSRTKESTSGGIDYWIMNADGSNQQRLTYFNEPWSSYSRGYANAGGWALDPTDPDHLLVGVCSDLVCETSRIMSLRLSAIDGGDGTGLKGDYFADSWLIWNVMTRPDPHVGFNWGNDAPAPFLPADNFAVRWTGSLHPYTTGSHVLCTYADDGARLWLDDKLVVDAWYNQGPTEHCNSVWLDATSPASLRLEYYDASLGATAKLTWQVPGQTVKEVIPSTQLTPL